MFDWFCWLCRTAYRYYQRNSSRACAVQFLGHIARTQCIDAACCYRCSVVRESYKNSWTDWGAAWDMDSGKLEEPWIRWGRILRGRGNLGEHTSADMQSYVRKWSVNLLTTRFQILKLKRRHSGWKLSQQLKGKMIFAAARLIYGQCHSDRISNALIISSEPGANGGWRWPCSCTRPLMELRYHTWVNWFVSPICLVDVPSALLGPIVCW